jgi:hypothetical protein
MGGKDASKSFWKYHNESILKKFKPQLQVGSLDTKPKAAAPPPPPPAPKKELTPKPVAESGTVSVVPEEDDAVPLDVYGDLVPYADPNWYQSVRANTTISQFRR